MNIQKEYPFIMITSLIDENTWYEEMVCFEYKKCFDLSLIQFDRVAYRITKYIEENSLFAYENKDNLKLYTGIGKASEMPYYRPNIYTAYSLPDLIKAYRMKQESDEIIKQYQVKDFTN